MKILELKNIEKRFGGVRAVDGVSLSLEEGTVAGLIGPNGSGKSTLFNLISGLDRPDSGEVRFRGERIDELAPSERFQRGLTKTFQTPSLFLNMTTLENTMVPPKRQVGEKPTVAPFHSKWFSQEMSLAEEASKVIEFLQLGGAYSNLTKNLSGGQMKLCELGRVLMGEPSLMLLDEPTAGVAPHLAHEILKRIIELRKLRGLTFFIIEHRLEIFLDYVDHVYVMNLGKLIAEGNPQEVVDNPLVREVYLGA